MENKEVVVMEVVVTMMEGGADVRRCHKSPCHFLWREWSVESEDLR